MTAGPAGSVKIKTFVSANLDIKIEELSMIVVVLDQIYPLP
jgi:hypothetical protein